MFIAIRYMEDDCHAIAEAVGGFDKLSDAEAFIERHWADYDAEITEAFELSSPNGYVPL